MKYRLTITSITIFIILFFLVSFLSSVTSFPYDNSLFFLRFYWFYLDGVQPFYYMEFGLYYTTILYGSLFLNIPFLYLHVDNAIIQEFTIKIPFLLSVFFSAWLLNHLIRKEYGFSNKFKKFYGYAFIFNPVIIFIGIVFGNPMIVMILFLLFSLFFIKIGKLKLSSIFLGMAVSTYLYPIFFILPFLRYIKKNNGKNSTLSYIIIFLIVVLIGQGIPLLSYILMGIPLSSGSLFGSVFASPSSVHISSSAVSNFGIYIIPYFIFHYNMPTGFGQILLLVFMSIPMLVFTIIPIKIFSIRNIFVFLLIENLIFILFVSNSAPQYLISVSPFVYLLFAQKNDIKIIILLIISTFFDFLSFVTSSTNNLFVFFYNSDRSIMSRYVNWPNNLYIWFGILYVSTLIIMLFYVILTNVVSNKTSLRKVNYNFDAIKIKPIKKLLYSQFFTFIVIILITVIIVSPTLTDPSNTMEGIEGQTHCLIEPKKVQLMDDSCKISFYSPVIWNISNHYAKSHSNFRINFNVFPFLYGDFGQSSFINVTRNNSISERISIPYTHTSVIGYFFVFGTPTKMQVIIYNSKNSMNLTNNTTLYQTIYGSHNLYEINAKINIPRGNYTILIRLLNNPRQYEYLSVTNIPREKASYNLINGTPVSVNKTLIPVLCLNGNPVNSTTMSFYLEFYPNFSGYLNGVFYNNLKSVNADKAKDLNCIDIELNNNVTLNHLSIEYSETISNNLKEISQNYFELLIGVFFFILISISTILILCGIKKID